MKMRFRLYDPAWAINLASQQRPDLVWLSDSLRQCTSGHEKRSGRKRKCIYVYFVDPIAANTAGAEWQYRETIELRHPEYGRVKLDILKDNRIGGIEFYDRLFS